MILPYDVLTNIVWSDTQTAGTLMDSVASGRKLIQLICSPSGFGKTTIAKKRFKQHGIVSEKELYSRLPPLPEISATSFPSLPPAMLKSRPQSRQTAMRRAVMGLPPFENARKRLFIEARPTKPISLVRTLHQCSMLQAAALLFDDPGRIAGDEASCDILKTGFGVQRTVAYETPEITRNENWRISGHGGYDPFVPPPDFPIPADLRWLWLANVNYTDPSVLAKLGDHFAPLIARGLNPFWIRDDAEHDHRDLFLYVHWLATEQNLLRSMGFTYEVSRKAVNYYVGHANRLVDLCPRRLELVAQAFAANQPPVALEAELNSMAPSVIRPKLRLPAPWIAVPDGVLLWPEQPFSKVKRPVEGQPPRRIRRREREYKRLHGQSISAPAVAPDPDPPPAAAMQPVQPDPEPDPDPAPAAPAPTSIAPEWRPHPPTAFNPAASPAPQPATDAPAPAPEAEPIEQLSGDAAPPGSEAVASEPPAPSPTVGDRDRVAMLLTTPLPELAPTLTVQDDIEFSRLTGDQASVQTALLARSRFFAAVADLTQMQTVSLRELAADVLDYLRHTRSSKFWSMHSDSPVNLIMQHAQKLMQANKKKNGAA